MKARMPWWDRLNAMLTPYIGPPPLGPDGHGLSEEKPLAPTGSKPCPICGEPMDEHEIERGDGRAPTRIHCPRDFRAAA